MDAETLIAALKDAGWREYAARPDKKGRAHLFEGPRVKGPACDCNDRPPPVHLEVYLPLDYGVGPPRGLVLVKVTGQRAGGLWLDADLYHFSYEETMAALPDAVETAGRVWRAFCGETA